MDVFHGDNAGLILAEIEFESEEAARAFQPPKYLAYEVTGLKRYYNSSLIKYPFSQWTEEEKAGG